MKFLFVMCNLSCVACVLESCSLEVERKVGGRVHLKLNIGLRPIANKYLEGIVKRTLKRKLKEHEIAEMEANETDVAQ